MESQVQLISHLILINLFYQEKKNISLGRSFPLSQKAQSSELRCMLYYVYILKCADGKHYVRFTKDFKDRMARHRRGEVKYTSTRLLFEVKAIIAVPDQYVALKLEDYLKTGSGRAFASKHLFHSGGQKSL